MPSSTPPGNSPRAPRQFSEADFAQIKQRISSDVKLQALLGFFNTYAEASEYQLILTMVHNGIWSGSQPAPPNGSGELEFGLLAYGLNNPGDNVALKTLQSVWKVAVGSLPPTHIDAPNYQNLMNATALGQPGVVGPDGTIYGKDPYKQLDPGWDLAPLEYLWHYLGRDFAPFGQGKPPVTIPLTGKSSSQVTIAMVGDWGTGSFPHGEAGSVMNAILGLNPDYIIHLGDVYYAGMGFEEQTNFLDMWPSSYAGKSFTLNSNHEMYDGAYGYFQTALNPENNIFAAQQGNSYFALQYGSATQPGGPWTIIGLDSGYWTTAPFVMKGSITEPTSTRSGATAQPQFIQGLVKSGLSPQNAIVLTHHNPIKYDGSALVTDAFGNNLWAQVISALGGSPAGWYWGHVHNGIVYPNPILGNKVYGRCVGHGALPFGDAWGLTGLPPTQVLAYDNTPSGYQKQMMNGFVLLTITMAGQVTETFYQQDKSQAPWAKPFTYQLGKSAAAAGGGG
jgi:hypothetical protein